MATSTNITTSYSGESAGKYISAALLSSNTIENGGLEVRPNVKYKEVVKKLSTDDLLKDGSCDFTATSTITSVERILEPKELQVNLQLCKKDFRDDWEAVSMGYSAFDVLPKTFQDYLIAHVVAKVAQKNEQNIWTGVAATSGEYNGFATLLAADAALPTGNEVTGTTVDASNVIDELGKIVDAIPSALYGKEDLSIYIPQNIARAYIRALGGFGAAGLGANGTNAMGTQWYDNGSLSFDGVPLFMANGLASNVAVAAEKSNLFFGTSLLSDLNEVKIIDLADIDGSQNVRIVMRMTAGVQYGNVEDIITYGIVNSAN